MPKPNWIDLPAPPCTLPESPRYAHNTWAWLDIERNTLYHTQANSLQNWPQQPIHSLALPDQIACLLPTANPTCWLGLGRHGLWQLTINAEANTEPQTPPQHLLKAPYNSSTHRFNDGQADSQGRIWISSLVDNRQAATAALYCIEGTNLPTAPALQCTAHIHELICGNGLAFGTDGCSIWWADTRLRTVWRAKFDPDTGHIYTPNVVHQYHQGTERPDGAALSADGHYWLAVLDGYGLDHFDEYGTWIERVAVPLAKPTMPCWGGNNLTTLLVCGMGHANNPAVNLVACEGLGQGLAARFSSICTIK
jgi:sugar lactone lactonase YvrE